MNILRGGKKSRSRRVKRRSCKNMKSRTCKRSKKCSWRKRSKRAKGSCTKKSRRRKYKGKSRRKLKGGINLHVSGKSSKISDTHARAVALKRWGDPKKRAKKYAQKKKGEYTERIKTFKDKIMKGNKLKIQQPNKEFPVLPSSDIAEYKIAAFGSVRDAYEQWPIPDKDGEKHINKFLEALLEEYQKMYN